MLLAIGFLFGAIGGIIVLTLTKHKIVAVSQDSIFVFKASVWMAARPKALDESFPRTVLNYSSGLWGKTTIGDTRFWVNKRFQADIEAVNQGPQANPQIMQGSPPAPPPQGQIFNPGPTN